jgi:hypothetical protein
MEKEIFPGLFAAFRQFEIGEDGFGHALFGPKRISAHRHFHPGKRHDDVECGKWAVGECECFSI